MTERDPERDLTSLLQAATSGDEEAMSAASALLYEDLRRLARKHMRSERGDHTLQATALVHEAFVKLLGNDQAAYESRAHFLNVASLAMRQILISWARSKSRLKRGGDQVVARLEDTPEPGVTVDADTVLAVHHGLEKLAEMSPRAVRVVECRYFAGLSIEETAEALGLSLSTVKREWRTARVWLRRELASRS